uniref:Choline/ethanolamine kinase n=1 Tax=Rhabditophanes sp. KR3021 TaxID=114890 RepID=A0AC35TX74_9BILA
MVATNNKEIPFFNYELPLDDQSKLDEMAITLTDQIFPEWACEEKNVSYFTNGITNKILKVETSNATDQMHRVIIRVFGKNTENYIDRDEELKNFLLLHSVGLSSAVYGTFKNGLVVGFLHGDTLNVNSIRDAGISKKVGKAVANLHQIKDSNNGKEAMIFDKIKDYFKIVSYDFGCVKKQKCFDDYFGKIDLKKDFEELKVLIKENPDDLVFCHNDLLCGNILFDQKKDAIHLIDYEYAGVNFRLFDIGNHFNEWAGVDEVDYSLLPLKDEKMNFLKSYLDELYQSEDAKEGKIDEMLTKLPLYEAASHYFWALWAVVQATNSVIDFDYVKYAVLRHSMFRKTLNEFIEK